MKILYVITGLDYGGAEKLLLTKCSYLVKHNFKIKVITIIKPEALVEEFISLGVEVESLNISGYYSLIPALKRYKRIVYTFKPDVIHAHMVHANLFSRIGSLFVKFSGPIINTIHDPVKKEKMFRNFLYRVSNRFTSFVTTISDESCANYIQFTGISPNKIKYIENFVDEKKFKNDELKSAKMRNELGVDDKFVWIAVGRLYKQKDYPNLINAFEKLAKDYKNNVLLIVGRGPLEGEIKSIIEEYGLSNKIKMLGACNNVDEMLIAANAYVMSSAWEGQPIALLEAAAAGLPIVATDVGGNNTIVKSGFNGYIVPAADNAALYLGMQRILDSDNQTKEQMGMNSRRLIEQEYSTQSTIVKYLSIYKKYLR